MTLRWNRALASGTGVLTILFGSLSAIGQDTPRLRPRGEVEVNQEEGTRRDRAEGRAADRDRPTPERLREELNELRRILDEERAARLRAVERLERARMEQDRTRAEAEAEADRVGRDRRRVADREAPGAVEVAEARVRAAEAATRSAAERIGLTFEKVAALERLGREEAEVEILDARLDLAEAEAALAEAEARLVEARYDLGRVQDVGDAPPQVEPVVKVESRFTVDDALETAEKVISLIRRFGFEDRPR